jgi:5'-nucleotidase
MTEKKNVLISNDDGIHAPGISALAKALAEVANVYIVAPDDERSCTSHSITLDRPVVIREVDHPYAERAFETDGYPADCVKMGLDVMESRLGVEIDCVFSGINMGANMGSDVVYSGTVAAALEGGISNKTSIAVSHDSYVVSDYDYACDLAVEVFRKVEDRLDEHMIININVPDLPREEIKGVKIANLGYRDYDLSFNVEEKRNGMMEYSYAGDPLGDENADSDNDVPAVQNGYATVTPITFYMTDHKLMDEVRSWDLKVK